MAIDNFKRVDIVLDKANSYILDDQLAKVGDIQGRDLVVQITNGGVVQSQPDIKLIFSWHNKKISNSGMTDFAPLDQSQGIFKVTFPDEMNNAGNVVATIGVNEADKWTFSRNFIIKVEENAFTASVPLESDDWATLLTALNKVDHITELTEQQLSEFIEKSKKEWAAFVEANKDIITAIDPGGVLLDEIIKARKPENSPAFDSLGERLNASDKTASDMGDAVLGLTQNSLPVNTHPGLSKMKVMAKILRTDPDRVFQGAQFDKSGMLYLAEQTDDAGSQLLNKYDPTTEELLASRSLNLSSVVWLEGNSLVQETAADPVKFIIPTDTNGNWLIYNFDDDTKSAPFKLEGAPKYCVDNTGKYFLTLQNGYNSIGYVSGDVVGFNVYDVSSLLNLSPKFVKFIPTRDSLVRGNNKIQGYQMIDNYIYIGRGTDVQWFRTTVINTDGALIDDFSWDKQDLNKLFGLDGNISVESEGFCFIDIDGRSVPVMNFLLAGGPGLHYALVGLGLNDGIPINYTPGATMAGLTKPERLGSAPGLTFIGGGLATDESILTKFGRIKEPGTYTFTVAGGNPGISKLMKTTNGIIVVREVSNGAVSKASAFGSDYDNVFWSSYCSNGQWQPWSIPGAVPIHITGFDFDPLTASSGTYRTGSIINRPSGSGGAKIYTIYQSLEYKAIVAYDCDNNEQYQRTFMPNGVDTGWKKLTSVSVAKTAYQAMVTQASLELTQSQNAKMAYQMMINGGNN